MKLNVVEIYTRTLYFCS